MRNLEGGGGGLSRILKQVKADTGNGTSLSMGTLWGEPEGRYL